MICYIYIYTYYATSGWNIPFLQHFWFLDGNNKQLKFLGKLLHHLPDSPICPVKSTSRRLGKSSTSSESHFRLKSCFGQQDETKEDEAVKSADNTDTSNQNLAIFLRNCLEENSWRTPNLNLWKGLASSVEHPQISPENLQSVSRWCTVQGRENIPSWHPSQDRWPIRFDSVDFRIVCTRFYKQMVPTTPGNLVVASFKGILASTFWLEKGFRFRCRGDKCVPSFVAFDLFCFDVLWWSSKSMLFRCFPWFHGSLGSLYRVSDSCHETKHPKRKP